MDILKLISYLLISFDRTVQAGEAVKSIALCKNTCLLIREFGACGLNKLHVPNPPIQPDLDLLNMTEDVLQSSPEGILRVKRFSLPVFS